MDWFTDPDRRRDWTERLRRFESSGSTVAAFCEREQVSVPSFYQWRRKLRGVVGARAGAGRKGHSRVPQARDFVPLQITRSATIELRLPNGTQVWLPIGDAATLAAAIATAGKLGPAAQEDEAC